MNNNMWKRTAEILNEKLREEQIKKEANKKIEKTFLYRTTCHTKFDIKNNTENMKTRNVKNNNKGQKKRFDPIKYQKNYDSLLMPGLNKLKPTILTKTPTKSNFIGDNSKNSVVEQKKEIVIDLKSETKNFIVDSKKENFIVDTKNENVIVDNKNINVIVDTKNENFIVETKPKDIIVETKPKDIIVETKPKDIIIRKPKDNIIEKKSAINIDRKPKNIIVEKKSAINIVSDPKKITEKIEHIRTEIKAIPKEEILKKSENIVLVRKNFYGIFQANSREEIMDVFMNPQNKINNIELSFVDNEKVKTLTLKPISTCKLEDKNNNFMNKPNFKNEREVYIKYCEANKMCNVAVNKRNIVQQRVREYEEKLLRLQNESGRKWVKN